MTHTKILIGQIFICGAIVILALWTATQWTAHTLGYQPGLGNPWFMIAGEPVYKPWRLFQWWYAYEAYAPGVFMRGGAIAASGGLLAALAAVIGSVLRARHQKHVTTYGSARWATKRDLKKAGLLRPSGVFLGQWKDRYLRHHGPEHVLSFAPTRSGKGVGLVIPTLLSWTGSSIVHDIKGENWSLTSKWRSSFSRCLRFDPTNPDSVRFNPLLEVRRGDNEVRDVQNIADILVDPEGSLERRNHWERTAHALLVGVILHVLYAEKDKTLSGAAAFLSDPSRSIIDTLNLMMSTHHIGDKPHDVVAQAARELLNKSENERSGVLSTAMSFLSLYRDPVLARATATSDFQIKDLISTEQAVSLYLVVPPSDISRTKPLIRLMLNQIGRRLTERLPSSEKPQREVLLMLDEFPALGRLDFFETTLAFMAGYGVRAFLIAQSLNQIDKAYGPNNSILDNCHVRVAFATNDERTAKRISEALGTATEQRAQRNYTGHRLAPWLAHVMVSRQETSRPLLTTGEVMQLPSKEELVLVSGTPPVRASKLRYFEDRSFIERVGEMEAGTVATPPPSHDWTNVVDAKSAGSETTSSADLGVEDDGGPQLQIPLSQDSPDRQDPTDHDAKAPEVVDDIEGESETDALDTVRRAAALDHVDDKLLPDF
jgi:type IV secretion system protein VirD4